MDTPKSKKSVLTDQTPVKKVIKLPIIENLFVSADRLMSELTKLPRREDDVYLAGDLVWVKTKGFPWWPCMITVDPESGKYSKIVVIRDKNDKSFHVQYFGSKAYRGYTQGNIMKYDGKEKYELKLDQIKNTPTPNKSQRKMELNNYEIKQSSRKDWNIACNQADDAMKLDRSSRIETLTFEYIVDKPKTTVKKQNYEESLNDASDEESKSKSTKKSTTSTKKRKINAGQPTSAAKKSKSSLSQSAKRPKKANATKSSSPSDVYDFNEFAEEFQEDATPKKPFELSSARRHLKKGEFSIYAKKLRADIAKENPELDDEEIEAKLKRNWELMSDDMRSSYAPRSNIFESDLSFHLDSPEKSMNDTNISIPDLNNSTKKNKSSNKKQKKSAKKTEKLTNSASTKKQKTPSTGTRRGRKPKSTTGETNGNDFEKENEADEMETEDNQTVEENDKDDDEEVQSATNRTSSRKRLFNQGNETNETINENTKNNTPKRRAPSIRTSNDEVKSKLSKASPATTTTTRSSIKKSSSTKKTPSTTPSTRTSTRSSSRKSIENGISENKINDDESIAKVEETNEPINDLETKQSNSINEKEMVNGNEQLVPPEETNGINKDEDIDSLNSESEKTEPHQKEAMNEKNKEKHCAKCLETDEGLVKCDGDCLSHYHKECLHQTSS